MANAPLQLLFQGAEARLYSTIYEGKDCIIKERFVKAYRHPSLDDTITLHRMRNEIRTMHRCRQAGIPAPTPFHVDLGARRIYVERIASITVREYLKTHENVVETGILDAVAAKVGELIAALHRSNIVHGDLTTSNMLLRGAPQCSGLAGDRSILGDATIVSEETHTEISAQQREETQKKWRNKQKELDKLCEECARLSLPEDGSFVLRDATTDTEMRLFAVDFGLSSVSQLAEDKAVDLYVLERSFRATHPRCETLLDNLFAAYERNCACATCSAQNKDAKTPADAAAEPKVERVAKPTCDVMRKLEEVRARGRKRTMVG